MQKTFVYLPPPRQQTVVSKEKIRDGRHGYARERTKKRNRLCHILTKAAPSDYELSHEDSNLDRQNQKL